MKPLLFILILSTSAWAGLPCDEAKEDFKRAQEFGATDFKCEDQYDGSAGSTWDMEPEQFKQFMAAEAERQRKRIKGEKKK